MNQTYTGPITPLYPTHWPHWTPITTYRVHILELIRGDIGPFVLRIADWAPMADLAKATARRLGVRPRTFDLYCNGARLPTGSEEIRDFIADGDTVIVQLKHP
jgi:hypothetical protein